MFSVCARERESEKAKVRECKCVEYEFGKIADLYVNILQYVYIDISLYMGHTSASVS